MFPVESWKRRRLPLNIPLAFLIALVGKSCNFTDAQTKTILYSPSSALIINPERGFYQVEVTGMTRGAVTPYDKLDPQRLREIRERHSLVFRYFGLKAWRTTDLPDSILQFISEDFSAVRNAGLKVIPRFAYAANIGEPDAPLNVILRHLDQLKPILQQNSDVIAVMQAGFIGAWGEWHSSTNGNESLQNKRAVLSKILDVLPSDRMVQVRTPRYKQEIFALPFDETAGVASERAFDGSPVSRVGHHNDCILADASDMGTYVHNGELDTARAKAYLRMDNRFVPMGGESCQPSNFAECQNALREFARLRWTFLNADYDERVLAGFVNGGCMDELRLKLGYRFTLLRAEFTSEIKPAGRFVFTVRILNSGWASPFNRRDVELLLRSRRNGAMYQVRLPADPRFWQSGDTATISVSAGIPATIREGAYDVLLHFADPSPSLHQRAAYAIRLANENTWEPTTGFNNLLDSIVVNSSVSGELYDGVLWFQALDENHSRLLIPTEFSLQQNYPNPFNAATTIPFVIPRPCATTLTVFDVAGRKIKQLVNDILPRSSLPYLVRFDANSFAGGMYVAQLLATPVDGSGAASFTASRKLLLTK